VSADPHLEELVPHSPLGSQAAVAEVVSTLGGFVAALALMPGRWLLMTAFFAGCCALAGLFRYVSWRRKLRRTLAEAPAPPRAAVEVRPRRRRGRRVVLAPAFLLGAAWLSSALDHSPFALGLLGAATLVGTALAAEVFYVERAPAL
jgi:hypothetical protein